jgi:hypothetical protein
MNAPHPGWERACGILTSISKLLFLTASESLVIPTRHVPLKSYALYDHT